MENNPVPYRPWQPQAFRDDDPGAPAPTPNEEGSSEFVRGHGEGGAAAQSSFEPRGGTESPTPVDFAAIKFTRESTLLTNADAYAASIRHEAELYVQQIRAEVDALNSAAEQRYAEAQRVKEQAEAEAAGLVSSAHADADSVRDAARAEGFEAGREEGLRKRYEEAGENLKNLDAIYQQLSQFRRQVRFFVEKDSIRLAVLLVKKILHQELKVNKQVVLKLLAGTLSKLEGTGVFRVLLSPEDYKFAVAARPALQKYLGEDQSMSLRSKADLSPGSVLIESDREVIDLTLESQLHHFDTLINQALAERETVVTRQPEGKQPAAKPKAPPAKPAPAPKDGAKR